MLAGWETTAPGVLATRLQKVTTKICRIIWCLVKAHWMVYNHVQSLRNKSNMWYIYILYLYLYLYLYVYLYLYLYMYIYISICIYIYMNVCINTCIKAHAAHTWYEFSLLWQPCISRIHRMMRLNMSLFQSCLRRIPWAVSGQCAADKAATMWSTVLDSWPSWDHRKLSFLMEL